MDYMAQLAAEEAKCKRMGRATHQMMLDKATIQARFAEEYSQHVQLIGWWTLAMVEQDPSIYKYDSWGGLSQATLSAAFGEDLAMRLVVELKLIKDESEQPSDTAAPASHQPSNMVSVTTQTPSYANTPAYQANPSPLLSASQAATYDFWTFSLATPDDSGSSSQATSSGQHPSTRPKKMAIELCPAYQRWLAASKRLASLGDKVMTEAEEEASKE